MRPLRNSLALLILLCSVACAQQRPLDEFFQNTGSSAPESLKKLEASLRSDPTLLQTSAPRVGRRGRLPLLAAALEKGDLGMVRLLLKHGARVDRVVEPGSRPILHFVFTSEADGAKKRAALEALLEAGADAQARDALNRNLFHALVESHPWEVDSEFRQSAERLLELGVPLEQEDHQGYTPLLAAVMRHNSEVVSFLLNLGADAERKSSGLGMTARQLAEQQRHTNCHPQQALKVWEAVR